MKKRYSYLFFLILIVGVITLRRMNVALLARVDGQSMMPTLQDGDIMFCSSLAKPSQGDIVCVKRDDGTWVVKRLVGMPGDEVLHKAIFSSTNKIVYAGNTVLVNGSDEFNDYKEGLKCDVVVDNFTNEDGDIEINPPGTTLVHLAEDECFIVGDNRDDSLDSRRYGPVKMEQVKAKVLVNFSEKWRQWRGESE